MKKQRKNAIEVLQVIVGQFVDRSDIHINQDMLTVVDKINTKYKYELDELKIEVEQQILLASLSTATKKN